MKFKFISILILNFFSLILTKEEKYKEKIIYFPIVSNFNAFYANIFIGEPEKKVLLPLDQEMQILWADSGGYHPENSVTSKTISETKISFRYHSFYGKTISDKICLKNNIDINTNEISNTTKNISLDNFWFITVGNIRGFDSRVGGIGLAYKFEDEKYSLIHQLKNKSLISHLNYGFIPSTLINTYNNDEIMNINETNLDNKNKNGIIFFGGVPKNYINDKYRYNCKLTEKYNFWSCELSYVFIGEINKYNNSKNIYFTNKNYAYFNAADRRILAPKDFMSFLKINYFIEELLNRTCTYSMYGHNHIFECNCNIIDKFPNITFIFDNYKYIFTSSELFLNYGGGFCQFLIQENHLRSNNFLLGSPFLSKFISNFDYETKYISFYSENQLEGINLNELFHPSHLIRNLMILGIIIIFIVIVCLIRRKIKNRQNKKDLLLKIKSKGKSKIKNMNKEEEGYEME